MKSSSTAVVLVDHKFHALTDRFLVQTIPGDLIIDLKRKVKEERFNELSDYNLSYITLWRTKGKMVINKLNWARAGA
jgi:hypothetical protein